MAVATAELLTEAREHSRRARRLFADAQFVRMAREPSRGQLVADARRTRLALEEDWEVGIAAESDRFLRQLNIPAAVAAAERGWKEPPPEPHGGMAVGVRLRKAYSKPRGGDLQSVRDWGGDAAQAAENAIARDGQPGWRVMVQRGPSGEPLAVAAVRETEKGLEVGHMGSRPGSNAGPTLVRGIAREASEAGLGLRFDAPSPSTARWLAAAGGADQVWTAAQAAEYAMGAGYSSPHATEVSAALLQGMNVAANTIDGVQVYLALAAPTGTAAGQYTLDSLGLGKTFAWAHPRAMSADLYAVRGSKVIQNLHGAHLGKLTQLITEATDPRHPMTLAQVQRKIQDDWPQLKTWQAKRIARTETAAVWTSTAANAYMANGVEQFESIVAHGPAIEADVNGACDLCVEMAADGPLQLGGDMPPWHPNCRCDMIPVLDGPEGEAWLPPDEPYTGGLEGPDIPVCGTVQASRAMTQRSRLQKMGAVLKADVPKCLIPTQAPGEAFGGDIYYNIGAIKAASKAKLLEQVKAWPDGNDAGKVRESIVNFLAFLASDDATKWVGVFGPDGQTLKGLAAFEISEKSTSVYGVWTPQGGASKLVYQAAKYAYLEGTDLRVMISRISPQLRKNLEAKGMKADPNEHYLLMTHQRLAEAFGIKNVTPEEQAVFDLLGVAAQTAAELDASSWSALQLLAVMDNPGPGLETLKGSVLREIERRGHTVDRLREMMERAAQASRPGATVPTDIRLTPGGWQKVSGASKWFDEQMGRGSVQLKRGVANSLVTRLKNNPAWNADAVSRGYGYAATAYGVQGDEAVVAQLINNWAQTSSDSDKRALAIQMAAKEEFDLPGDVFPATSLGNESASRQLIADTNALMDSPGVRDALRAFVREQYNLTQEVLAEAGIDSITAYRGMRTRVGHQEGWMGQPGFGEVMTTDNPLASWSTRFSISKRFSSTGSGAVMLRAEVPRELILGFPVTGFGCSNEFEMVVLNHGGNSAWALVSGSRAMTAAEKSAYEARRVALDALAEEQRIAYEAAVQYSPEREKLYKKWTKTRNELQSVNGQLSSGHFRANLGTESEYAAEIKKLAPEKAAAKKKPGAAKPVGDVKEEIRLIGKKLGSLRHKMKHPEKYKAPNGWTPEQLAAMQKQVDDLEARRTALKEGKDPDAEPEPEDIPVTLVETEYGGKPQFKFFAPSKGDDLGQVTQLDTYGHWLVGDNVAQETKIAVGSKGEVMAWASIKFGAKMPDGVDLSTMVGNAKVYDMLDEGGGVGYVAPHIETPAETEKILSAIGWTDPQAAGKAEWVLDQLDKGNLYVSYNLFGNVTGVSVIDKTGAGQWNVKAIATASPEYEAMTLAGLKSQAVMEGKTLHTADQLVQPPPPKPKAPPKPKKEPTEAFKLKKKLANLKHKINHPDKYKAQSTLQPDGTHAWSDTQLQDLTSQKWDLEAEIKVAEGKPPAGAPTAEDAPPVPPVGPELASPKQSYLIGSYASGIVKTEDMFGGNTQKGMSKITFADGKQAVVKLIDPDEAVKEVLGAQVAEAIGTPAPAVVMLEEGIQIEWTPPWAMPGEAPVPKTVSKILMDFVDGDNGHKHAIPNGAEHMPKADIAGTKEAKLIGLFDVLTGNTDRHGLNWMVKDGKPVAIDHGKIFHQQVEGQKDGTSVPFTGDWVKLDKFHQIKSYVDNPLTQADMGYIRVKLLKLKPKFDAAGMSEQHAQMMNRLNQIGKKATGTVNLVAP